MTPWLERTELLIGEGTLKKLENSHVLICGLGGVGSYAAEFIARAGVGEMTIIDGDVFDITNINRQLPALRSTVGKSKAEVLAARLLDINPDLNLHVLNEFVLPERVPFLLETNRPDYVMDCIDSITPKLAIMRYCKRNKIKLISSMGAGGKMDPAQVKVGDISKVHNCKMGAHLKKQLKKEKIDKGIKAVYSSEIQKKESLKMTNGTNFKKSFYGTISYMPVLFGLYAAATVIDYLGKKNPPTDHSNH
jgi:tRNA A37 threonylcarbamoyladenosine dehydratase